VKNDLSLSQVSILGSVDYGSITLPLHHSNDIFLKNKVTMIKTIETTHFRMHIMPCFTKNLHYEILFILDLPNDFLSNTSRCIDKYPKWGRWRNIWDKNLT